MRQDIYQNGIRYAKSLIRQHNAVYNERDLVHDAYLKCKGDENYLIRCIRLTYNSFLRKKYIRVGGKVGKNGYAGEEIRRTSIEINSSGYESEDNTINIPSVDYCNIDSDTFINSLQGLDQEVLLLRLAGYEYSEIAEITGRNYSYVSVMIKMKEKIKQVL